MLVCVDSDTTLMRCADDDCLPLSHCAKLGEKISITRKAMSSWRLGKLFLMLLSTSAQATCMHLRTPARMHRQWASICAPKASVFPSVFCACLFPGRYEAEALRSCRDKNQDSNAPKTCTSWLRELAGRLLPSTSGFWEHGVRFPAQARTCSLSFERRECVSNVTKLTKLSSARKVADSAECLQVALREVWCVFKSQRLMIYFSRCYSPLKPQD